ncbi:hypothetical protein [Cryobacterium sp. TMT2-14]|uniref:hypothetical protein n=1 Tax=Cryobacterium sp. TMT2-14 TaxID=1259245 RepID=UPI001069DB5F|nr:hypothetical protein [Cryobacterium sp. TMT2-14]TFC33835.1 hypothetical protein E3O28_13140 [Cryobacterium sp. TMT2-14]
MVIKIFAAIALAVVAIFAVPVGANAASYVATETNSVSRAVVASGAVTLPPDEAGKYTLTGESDDNQVTGHNIFVLLIWVASGVLLLGAALGVVLTIVRRERDSHRVR